MLTRVPAARQLLVMLAFVILVATAIVIIVSTAHQTFSTDLPDQGSFAVEVKRQQFFPQTCASVTWESGGLQQILINGQIADERGTYKKCLVGDVLTTFLVVSKDYRTANLYSFRTSGALGLATLAVLAAAAVIFISNRYRNWAASRRERRTAPPRAEAVQASRTYDLRNIAARIVLFAGVLAAIQLLYPALLRDSLVTWTTYWLYLTLCSAPGFLDSGLKVITSTRPRPARRSRVALGLDSDSRTSPASTVRCTSA